MRANLPLSYQFAPFFPTPNSCPDPSTPSSILLPPSLSRPPGVHPFPTPAPRPPSPKPLTPLTHLMCPTAPTCPTCTWVWPPPPAPTPRPVLLSPFPLSPFFTTGGAGVRSKSICVGAGGGGGARQTLPGQRPQIVAPNRPPHPFPSSQIIEAPVLLRAKLCRATSVALLRLPFT